jgi:DNA-binding transcriptional MocR family regulator
MKNDVVDLDSFEKLIEKEKNSKYTVGNEKIFWAMYYTVPIFHNPTGMSISSGNHNSLIIMINICVQGLVK